MIPFLKPKAPMTLLGLRLGRNLLQGVVLHRNGSGFSVRQRFRSVLSLDPLTNDPELVGREILNHLTEAGVRERRCTLCLPLNWALTVRVPVPELPADDTASYLNLEAEKGFPYSPDDLCVASSRYQAASGDQFATLVAIPRNHLVRLQSVLKAARLKPQSFSLAVPSLCMPPAGPGIGVIDLLVGESCVELQVAFGSGVVVLRALEGVIETEGGHQRIDADQVARELKITLGQMPRALGETVRALRVFGPPEIVGFFLTDIQARVEGLGLKIDRQAAPSLNGTPLPTEKGVLPELGLAAERMLGIPPRFEFLPPKVSSLPQVLAKVSARKLASTIIVVVSALILTIAAFLFQHVQLRSLENQWRKIQPTVTELEDLQQRIRRYRSWFDSSFPTLTILRSLAEVFPAEGNVSAKRLEIRDLSMVTCSGTATDYAAYQAMIERLRALKPVAELKQDQVQGNSPLQFSINFQWLGGVAHD